MKALFLVSNFPPLVGGSCNYYGSIYRLLRAKHVRVLSPIRPGYQDFDAGFPHSMRRFRAAPSLSIMGRFRELPRYVSWLLNALWTAFTWRPSVVHCGEVMPTGVVGLFLKKTLGVPYLVFVHGEELTTTRRLRYQSRLMRRVLESADHVVAACSMAKVEAEDIVGHPMPSTIIFPGVDLERFNPSVDPAPVISRYGLSGKRILLTVGRLDEEHKGHDMVIRALPAILDRVPDALYIIAGRGQRSDLLSENARRLGVQGGVRFLGPVPDAELPALYAAANLFVMPNRQLANGHLEGFGMVFLEASACGRPVIAGRSGGTDDSVVDGQTGFLVNPTDELELVDRIVTLLNDRELALAMGRRGRTFAENGFDWRTQADSLWRISTQLANVESPRQQHT